LLSIITPSSFFYFEILVFGDLTFLP
jgi:hypothetical protein